MNMSELVDFESFLLENSSDKKHAVVLVEDGSMLTSIINYMMDDRSGFLNNTSVIYDALS